VKPPHLNQGHNTTRTGRLLTKVRRETALEQEQRIRKTITNLELRQRRAYRKVVAVWLSLGEIDRAVEIMRKQIDQ
jgi:hypothetical protein